MLLYLLRWWYGPGFGWVVYRIESSLEGVGHTLAIGVLLKTWFAPWKQITTQPGEKVSFIQKALDSLISRFVGFFVRSIMLLTGLVWGSLVIIVGIVWLIIWAFIPVLPIVLLALFSTGTEF